MAGITNNVRISENINPPTTTIPSGTRLAEEAPRLSAMGNAPNEVARLVINMGRNRCCDGGANADQHQSHRSETLRREPLLLFLSELI